jgi:hypothetical protein
MPEMMIGISVDEVAKVIKAMNEQEMENKFTVGSRVR